MNSYLDRAAAGKILATVLGEYALKKNTLVLGLARGGVPVAFEIATRLHLPLDVFIVRKLGAPHCEELALGAIASENSKVINHLLLKELHLSESDLNSILKKEQQELYRREKLYRNNRDTLLLRNKTVILIDDGMATGATMQAAVLAIKKLKAQKIIVAIPVGAPEACHLIRAEVDTLICPLQPLNFTAVGNFYDSFPQTTDQEVISILASVPAQ